MSSMQKRTQQYYNQISSIHIQGSPQCVPRVDSGIDRASKSNGFTPLQQNYNSYMQNTYEKRIKKKVQYMNGKMVLQNQLSNKQQSCINLLNNQNINVTYQQKQMDNEKKMLKTFNDFNRQSGAVKCEQQNDLKEKIKNQIEQEKYYGLKRNKFQNYKYQMPNQNCQQIFELKKSKSRLQVLKENIDRNKYKKTMPQLEDFMRFSRIATNRDQSNIQSKCLDINDFKRQKILTKKEIQQNIDEIQQNTFLTKTNNYNDYILKYYNMNFQQQKKKNESPQRDSKIIKNMNIDKLFYLSKDNSKLTDQMTQSFQIQQNPEKKLKQHYSYQNIKCQKNKNQLAIITNLYRQILKENMQYNFKSINNQMVSQSQKINILQKNKKQKEIHEFSQEFNDQNFKIEGGIQINFFKQKFQQLLNQLDTTIITRIFKAFDLDYTDANTQINFQNFMVIHDLIFKEKIHETFLKTFIQKFFRLQKDQNTEWLQEMIKTLIKKYESNSNNNKRQLSQLKGKKEEYMMSLLCEDLQTMNECTYYLSLELILGGLYA